MRSGDDMVKISLLTTRVYNMRQEHDIATISKRRPPNLRTFPIKTLCNFHRPLLHRIQRNTCSNTI